ncbi:MAG: hypothetical protein ACR2QO_17200 [Acidimicrobiales bacterium]
MTSGFMVATALGLFIGLLGGEPRRVSVEIWLVVATAWFAWLLIGELTSVAPLRPDRLEGFFSRRRSEEPIDERARRLANLEGLIANASHSPRAATIRLRPRLVTVTRYLLRSSRGIDAATDPDAAALVLGDVGWLVDEDHEMVRSPTAAEVELVVTRAAGNTGDTVASSPVPEPMPDAETQTEVDR